MNKIYLNGAVVERDQAKISVFDRGFLFSDGVYEVIPRFNKKFVGMEPHVKRLRRSCEELQIVYPNIDWLEVVQTLDESPDEKNEFLYIQITRGEMASRNHVFETQAKPTIVAWLQSFIPFTEEKLRQGFSAECYPDNRWGRCDIKSISLLANVLLKNASVASGAVETLLRKGDVVLEGSSSNLFIVKDQKVFTHPTGHEILPGITRDLVISLLTENGSEVVERPFTYDELMAADEAWVTSSTKNILPLVEIDGHKIGGGLVGPLWEMVHNEFTNKFVNS